MPESLKVCAGGRGTGGSGSVESVVRKNEQADDVRECVWTDGDDDHGDDVRNGVRDREEKSRRRDPDRETGRERAGVCAG